MANRTRERKNALSPEAFIERARAVHGDAYDYSHVEYRNTKVKVEIVCRACGTAFLQTPEKHMRGNGCPSPACCLERTRRTNLERYGVERPLQSEAIRARAEATTMARYGVRNAMLDEGLKKRFSVSRKGPGEAEGANAGMDGGTGERPGKAPSRRAGRTRPEEAAKAAVVAPEAVPASAGEDPLEAVYAALAGEYGADGVVRNYSCSRYRLPCGFYVPSRDLFVEYNGDWSHGGHWYDPDDREDRERLWDWEAKGASDPAYGDAAGTWASADCIKRMDAGRNGLNYVVLWSPDLLDLKVWEALGFPDGRDWERPWSWLPDRKIRGMASPSRLTGTPANLSQAAKAFQFREFYKEELRLWDENGLYKGVPLRLWLYANRLRYLGKAPGRLTDLDLARGFTIAGVHKGYTVFDTELMDRAVRKYGITGIYDPCAGWGERALYCRSRGVSYFGVDANRGLAAGYAAMAEAYGMEDQKVVFGDSASWPLSGKVHAVVTCPPYGGTEIYSRDGAENLGDEGFLAWWRRTVENSLLLDPDLFCFQVNRKWRDRMLAAVKDAGFVFADELEYRNNRSSHFTRKPGGEDLKRERETMLVLRRIRSTTP